MLDKVIQAIDIIVAEYLRQVSVLKNHNHFSNQHPITDRVYYFKKVGFPILYAGNDNRHVVEEEKFLEGCTRVFLVNPIIKVLMDIHGIENEWLHGDTFGNFTITTREYEAEYFIEFIAVIDEKKIGFRYLPHIFGEGEAAIMDYDKIHLLNKEQIPGFKKLGTVDKVQSIIWADYSDETFNKLHSYNLNSKSRVEDVLLKSFFFELFSEEEYNIVIPTMKNAVANAQKIIALKSQPQLLPNNILMFKKELLNSLSQDTVTGMQYFFEKTQPTGCLNESDIQTMNHHFFENKLQEAMIGNSDFARSFITSEYLYKTIQEGLSIDYTAIIVGYLKSVEQLLYLLYISAFEGKKKLEYWDSCKKKTGFDLENGNYRFDPYNAECKQERYSHNKKTGEKAPEIGELMRFLRYYEKMWRVSEDGKEYIYTCLDDFRTSCRNSHFHKDNIDYLHYADVKNIRNNTILCIYYLLGGFEFLDKSLPTNDQLGMLDFSFENFYHQIMTHPCRLFHVKFNDDYCGIIYYLKIENINFSPSGIMNNTKMLFVKLYDLEADKITYEAIEERVKDEKYVVQNSLYITRQTMPVEYKRLNVKSILREKA